MRFSNLHEFGSRARMACDSRTSAGRVANRHGVCSRLHTDWASTADDLMIFAKGGRHEMLDELNREEVRTNLLVWLRTILRGQSHYSEALWAQQHQHHRIR
jgi:hypothetical protein